MMRKGVVLGKFISANGIQVDPSKIRLIENIPTPRTQKEVRRFLGHAGYYGRFIEKFFQTSFSFIYSIDEGCTVQLE